MICVEIDMLTPCLVDCITGDIIPTEVIRIKRKSFLEKFNKKNGWYVSWANLLDESEVYALVIKGTVDIQGLVAIHKEESMKSSFVDWMVAAPHNNQEIVENKRYKGVGGHLFAIAAKKSRDYGYNAAISGFAANRRLLQHYIQIFHAEWIGMIHPYQIFIAERDGERIEEVYTYDWTDDEL